MEQLAPTLNHRKEIESMDAEKQRQINIILKCLALGDEDRNTSDAQRQVAQQKAAELMAKWGLDFADLRTMKPKADAFIRVDIDGSQSTKVDWESNLAGNIARAFDGEVVNINSSIYWQLSFLGAKTDIEIVVFFFEFLRRTIPVMSRRVINEQWIRENLRQFHITPKMIREEQRTYCFGMVKEIGIRLMQLYKQREAFIPADCKALMVVKKDGIAEFVKDQFPRLRSGRPISLRGSNAAYGAGKEDGRRVNLNRPIEGGLNRGSIGQ